MDDDFAMMRQYEARGKHDASSPLEVLYQRLRRLEEIDLAYYDETGDAFREVVAETKDIAEGLRQEIISGREVREQMKAKLREQAGTIQAGAEYRQQLLHIAEELTRERDNEVRLRRRWMYAALATFVAAVIAGVA